jgi:hypothetical protein
MWNVPEEVNPMFPARPIEEDVETISKFSGDVYTIKQLEDGRYLVSVNGVSLGLEGNRQSAIHRVNDHFFYRLQTSQRMPA